MRKQCWLIWCASVFLLSCKSKDRTPGGLLPKEKMQAVLWDIMRADQFLTDYVFNKDTAADKSKESAKMYQQIFSLHKITWDEFRQSFAYYNKRPELIRPILDSIAASSGQTGIVPKADTAAVPKTDSAKIPLPVSDSAVRQKDAAPPVRQKDTTRRKRVFTQPAGVQ